MSLVNLSVYNDDEPCPADCRIDSQHSHAIAEMLAVIGRLEKLNPVKVKLIGDFNPRATLRTMKDRAVDGSRAVLVCLKPISLKPPDAEVVFFWSDSPEDETYKLANLRAKGFVLGTLVLNSDQSVDWFAEQDEEKELKGLLLDFLARAVITARSETTATNQFLSLADPTNFEPQNIYKTLESYTAWADQHPINIHDEISTDNVQGVKHAR